MPRGEEDAARGFFAGVLGMREEPKPAALAGRGGVWFRSGSAALHLGVDEPFAPARKAHPAFEVDNLDAAQAALDAAGIAHEPGGSLPGVADRLFVSDPFGNRIELLEKEA